MMHSTAIKRTDYLRPALENQVCHAGTTPLPACLTRNPLSTILHPKKAIAAVRQTFLYESKKIETAQNLENLIARLGRGLAKMQTLSRRLSWYRLLTFVIGGALVFISFFWINETFAWFPAAAAFVLFSVAAICHHRLAKGVRRHQICNL